MQNEKNDKKDKKQEVLIIVIGIAFLVVEALVAFFVSEDLAAGIFAFVIGFGFVGLVIYVLITNKNYMRKQKADNTDKKKLLALMAEVMGEHYGDYTYVTGFFEKTEPLGGRRYRVWYYSYVVAFNQTDMVILPFVVKGGQVLLRNRMPVDWNVFALKYHIYRDDINLDFMLGGEKTTIYIRNVIKSGGVENSSKPLAIYQESEAELLKNYLPGYPNATKA